MTTLPGYDGKFGLRCWSAGGEDLSHQQTSDDPATLRSHAARLIGQGAADYVELSNWNFELNDWVRMETFGARPPRAEV